jgi:hypothetical protein
VACAHLIDDAFRAEPGHRALFLRILQAPVGLVHALRRMNDMGILGRYLPNFRRIIGQMQHDLFHVYTVDQHIMMVVRNMRRFTMTEHAHEYPFCSQLIANFRDRWLLYVAALFHDIAKGRGGDHSNWASRTCWNSAATTALRRRHGTGGVPGRAAPDHVAGGAEAGPVRSGRDRRLRRPGQGRAPPDRAVPADGGRHPRHQPQGVERLEGQAAGRPVQA